MPNLGFLPHAGQCGSDVIRLYLNHILYARHRGRERGVAAMTVAVRPGIRERLLGMARPASPNVGVVAR